MQKKRRIGIDARLIYQTGVGVYLRNLLFHLANTKGGNTEIVVFARKNDWDKYVREYKPSVKCFEIRTSDVSWHSFAEQIIFLWQLLRSNLDLAHFPYFSWPILYFRPFVATVHDTILLSHATGRASTLPHVYYKFKQLVFRFVFALQVTRAKKLFAPSQAVYDELVRIYHGINQKIVVTHEGVDEVFAKCVSQKPHDFPYEAKSYFLYVGNCYPHKNVETLLEAFQHKFQIPNSKFELGNLRLVLVGPRSIFAEKLKDKYKNLGEDVLWMHDVDTAKLKWLYEHAKALVFPSKAEGFGLPIVEAQYVGCPLVLSDIPVFHEVAGENATYFGVNDVDGLVHELVKERPNTPKICDESAFSKLATKTFESYQMI